MNKLLVLPDIHGRTFWKKPCENIDVYDKVIFLGDYLDPYDFEKISVQDAINNFKEIIEFKKANNDKVILLIGNHDLPYFSKDYYNLSYYHCRHSAKYHNTISRMFKDNKDLFQLAYAYNEQTLSLKETYNDILFTHAGVDSGWLEKIVQCDKTNINDIADAINDLLKDANGLRKLFCITSERGGRDRWGSCVWVDVHDIMWDVDSTVNPNTIVKPIHKIKQIFGHTLQAYYDLDRNIIYGDAIEHDNIKMLDNGKAYILNTDTFEIEIYKQ